MFSRPRSGPRLSPDHAFIFSRPERSLDADSSKICGSPTASASLILCIAFTRISRQPSKRNSRRLRRTCTFLADRLKTEGTASAELGRLIEDALVRQPTNTTWCWTASQSSSIGAFDLQTKSALRERPMVLSRKAFRVRPAAPAASAAQADAQQGVTQATRIAVAANSRRSSSLKTLAAALLWGCSAPCCWCPATDCCRPAPSHPPHGRPSSRDGSPRTDRARCGRRRGPPRPDRHLSKLHAAGRNLPSYQGGDLSGGLHCAATTSLDPCTRSASCGRQRSIQVGFILHRGELELDLSWNTHADLDLSVSCPGGDINDYQTENKKNKCGALFDHDANRAGTPPYTNSLNRTWNSPDTARPGTYSAIVNSSGRNRRWTEQRPVQGGASPPISMRRSGTRGRAHFQVRPRQISQKRQPQTIFTFELPFRRPLLTLKCQHVRHDSKFRPDNQAGSSQRHPVCQLRDEDRRGRAAVAAVHRAPARVVRVHRKVRPTTSSSRRGTRTTRTVASRRVPGRPTRNTHLGESCAEMFMEKWISSRCSA